jgi:3'-phosphoadenosine 5'-phosphosulfate (PAPS) 3'-phosphatase
MDQIMVQSKIEAEKELEEQRIADLERKYGPETVARIRERQQQTNDEFAENFNIPPFSAKSGQIKASILAEEKEAVMAERRKRTQAIEAKTEK